MKALLPLLVVLLPLMESCSTIPDHCQGSDEGVQAECVAMEREWQEAMIKEAYKDCRGAYSFRGIVWVQYMPSSLGYDPQTHWPRYSSDMRHEMRDNGCYLDYR
jgi:hypothetical protein